jgi:hypothetical protein
MKKYILKSNGDFLHFEGGGIVSWHNINPPCLCAFDSKKEAQDIINDYSLTNTSIVIENFSETFF